MRCGEINFRIQSSRRSPWNDETLLAINFKSQFISDGPRDNRFELWAVFCGRPSNGGVMKKVYAFIRSLWVHWKTLSFPRCVSAFLLLLLLLLCFTTAVEDVWMMTMNGQQMYGRTIFLHSRCTHTTPAGWKHLALQMNPLAAWLSIFSRHSIGRREKTLTHFECESNFVVMAITRSVCWIFEV